MASPVTALCEDITATIASGQSLSDSINMLGRIITGIYMPASWTAAGLTFQASQDGSTWYNVHSADIELASAASAGIYISINPIPFYGCKYLKIRSGTSGSAVAQGAERILTVMAGSPDV